MSFQWGTPSTPSFNYDLPVSVLGTKSAKSTSFTVKIDSSNGPLTEQGFLDLLGSLWNALESDGWTVTMTQETVSQRYLEEV